MIVESNIDFIVRFRNICIHGYLENEEQLVFFDKDQLNTYKGAPAPNPYGRGTKEWFDYNLLLKRVDEDPLLIDYIQAFKEGYVARRPGYCLVVGGICEC